MQYKIRGVRYETFLDVLACNKLRWTKFVSPKLCPLCESGPIDSVVLDELEKDVVQMTKEKKPIPDKITQELRQLRKKVNNYRLHEEQLRTARAEANKKRDAMVPGEVGVTRDFVNHHDHAGAHVKCLHFVLQWREEEDEPLRLLKLRTYCSDAKTCSTDSYFVADAMDMHFQPGGHFDRFKRVYFFGDHGPHFASAATLFNESTAYRRYGKEIYNLFFASYHAFGRADGAGAEDKRSAREDLKNSIPRFGASSYAAMTNASNDPLSMAYELKQINRYT